jgi:hypothetical protein
MDLYLKRQGIIHVHSLSAHYQSERAKLGMLSMFPCLVVVSLLICPHPETLESHQEFS